MNSKLTIESHIIITDKASNMMKVFHLLGFEFHSDDGIIDEAQSGECSIR